MTNQTKRPPTRPAQKQDPARMGPNHKFLLRLRTFPNRSVRVLLQLDGRGQILNAVIEEVGKIEWFGEQES